MLELAAVALGYLCGSIPFGLLLTRIAGLGDIRSIGSGNIGATNVLRTGNRMVAALTLLLDAIKGAVPVVGMAWLGGDQVAIIAGLAAFFGHLFPVWLRFQGGKGVATNIGVLFGLYWPLGLAFLAAWLIVATIFRLSSLAALTAALLMPLWSWVLGRVDLILPMVIIGTAIFFTHRANIARLLKGEEPPIAFTKHT